MIAQLSQEPSCFRSITPHARAKLATFLINHSSSFLDQCQNRPSSPLEIPSCSTIRSIRGEDCLAGCFGDAAANGEVVLSEFMILHLMRSCSNVFVRCLKVFLALIRRTLSNRQCWKMPTEYLACCEIVRHRHERSSDVSLPGVGGSHPAARNISSRTGNRFTGHDWKEGPEQHASQDSMVRFLASQTICVSHSLGWAIKLAWNWPR